MGKGGRPSFLDDDSKEQKKRQRKFLALLKEGNSVRDALRASGVASKTAYSRAMARGKSARAPKPYRDFRAQVHAAVAESKTLLVSRWHKATAKNWRAAQALLRARYPEEFAPDLFIAKRVVDDDEPDEQALPGIRVRRQTRDEAEAQRQKKSDVDAGDED